MIGTCSGCQFALATVGGLECRRYPPTVEDVAGDLVVAGFRYVRPEDWCGEYQRSDRQSSCAHSGKVRRADGICSLCGTRP